MLARQNLALLDVYGIFVEKIGLEGKFDVKSTAGSLQDKTHSVKLADNHSTESTMFRLYHSTTSPYARKVNSFLHLTGFTEQTEYVLTNPFESKSLHNANPLSKVPALVDLERKPDLILIDSNLICEYLNHIHLGVGGQCFYRKDDPNYFLRQRVNYLASGIIDAAVSSLLETRREQQLQSPYWLKRWQDAIENAVRSIQRAEVSLLEETSIASISMGCALGYLDFRFQHFCWPTWNVHLAEWYEEFKTLEWFEATTPKNM